MNKLKSCETVDVVSNGNAGRKLYSQIIFSKLNVKHALKHSGCEGMSVIGWL